MCGINGAIVFKNQNKNVNWREIVHKMNDKIVHRGPNSEGLYSDDKCSLGMRRLSIIDVEGGTQPIWNEGKDKLIIFNGEIYNYKELRDRLISLGHIFSTNTDTETVLHLYEEYGEKSFEKLEGMFAFCIYDLKKAKWIIARDKIGEKPLYYYCNENFLLFSSELKGLLSTQKVPRQIDKEALDIYFQLTYIPAPKSIISNVYKLQQGSYMEITFDGEKNIKKYWTLEISNRAINEADYEVSKRKIRETVLNSVDKRMRSDVPLGAFLSGGIDSTVIVGAMSEVSDKKLDTFTIGFKEAQFDERNLAEIVAKKNDTNHHVLELDWKEVLKDLDYVLDNMDEPFADPSYIATFAVSKLAKQYVTVVLTGDAGDEIFAGYDKYLIGYYSDKYNNLPLFVRKGVIEPGVKFLPVKSTIRRKAEKVISVSNMNLFEQRKRMMSLAFKEEETIDLFKDHSKNDLFFIKEYYDKWDDVDEQIRAQYTDLNVVLEGDMLCKVDRASMLASLETRVPFLDTEIVETAFNLPSKFKIDKTQRKIILRDTFRDFIPEEINRASKKGFSVPIGEWLEKELKYDFEQYLKKDFLQEQGIFNESYIHDIWNAHLRHKENNYSKLWCFYVFQVWYDRYILNGN